MREFAAGESASDSVDSAPDLDLTDVRERLAFLVQRGLRKSQQPNAGFGRLRRIASAQQTGAQPMLQIGDGLADRRLREIQPLGRAAETAGFDDRVKATQFITFNLHGQG